MYTLSTLDFGIARQINFPFLLILYTPQKILVESVKWVQPKQVKKCISLILITLIG
jgi:hypothetical protein